MTIVGPDSENWVEKFDRIKGFGNAHVKLRILEELNKCSKK